MIRITPDRWPTCARRWAIRVSRADLAMMQLVSHGSTGWSALGDPTRRAIFEAIATRPQAVGEIADRLPVSRPAVSQHLKVLKDAKLVVGRRAGNRCIYEIDMDGIAALRSYLDQFWNQALTAYKAAVEKREDGE